MRKFRDRRGETLAETLCAVLVLALGVALLAAMISAASRLDRKTDQAVGELYQSFSKAENPDSSTYPTEVDGTVSVQIGDENENVNVTFYGNKEQVVSYRTESEGSTP